MNILMIRSTKLAFRASISNITAAKVIALIDQERDSKVMKPPHRLNGVGEVKE